jgi:hypothetical protein
VTTPSDASGTGLTGPVPFGTTLFDKAVVTGVAGGGTPTGTVEFFLCDPSQVQGPAGAETCPDGGTALSGNPRTLSADAGSSPPSASVLSSPGVEANTAGVWCFRADYRAATGSNYTDSSDASHSECITVSRAATATVTTPSDASGTGLTGPVPVGTQVRDRAVVTGVANGGNPTGTVAFSICDPSQIMVDLFGDPVCGGNGTLLDGAVPLSPIAGSSPPKSDALSSLVTATSVGTWCFSALYLPAADSNYTGSADATTTECFTVTDTTSATSAQDWLPNDSATITSTGGTALSGTLSFTLYSGDNCGETSGSQLRAPEVLTLTDVASPVTRSTSNSTVKVTVSTTVSWKVVFDSSNPNVHGTTHCETTSLTISN